MFGPCTNIVLLVILWHVFNCMFYTPTLCMYCAIEMSAGNACRTLKSRTSWDPAMSNSQSAWKVWRTRTVTSAACVTLLFSHPAHGKLSAHHQIKQHAIDLCVAYELQYEPELFPGLIYRMKEPKVVLLIFVSGKVVLTGMPPLHSSMVCKHRVAMCLAATLAAYRLM